jgi:glycosyltransferase involved in cell wall biosynthesis
MEQMDEIWTTSDLCARWFKEDGVTKPIHIYEHGIEHIWTPFKRRRSNVLRFLHIGEPAPRKNGQMAFNAFVELFGNDPRYQFTIKSNGYSTIRAKLPSGEIANPVERYKNVHIIKKILPVEELVALYHSHHVLLYPSYGEGFGFIPLQGMATGMPVIFNPTWAPYRRFSAGLDIEDRLIDSKWPEVHPGQILEPSYESLKEQMQAVADNFESYSDKAFSLAPQIHIDYDWVEVTRKAFAHVEKKFM